MNDMWRYESDAWDRGYVRVAGVDEVGRGPLAGPVVACAVVVPRNGDLPGVDDSKKLGARKREAAADLLHALPGVSIGLGVVQPEIIDKLNILRATHLAMLRAVENLGDPPDFLLIDGRPVPGLPAPSRAIVRGDGQSVSIAAASIVAKVHRDRMMIEYDRTFSGYGFASHKGYGTEMHLAALREHGPSPIHRLSFAPVAKLIAGQMRQPELGLW